MKLGNGIIVKTTPEMIRDKVHSENNPIGRIGQWAIVEKIGDTVQLKYTCNEQEEYDTIEEYDSCGWYMPLGFLDEDYFWNCWSEWNGYVSGGIYLDDDYYFSQWGSMLDEYEEVTIEGLKKMKDGLYKIEM